MGKPVSTSELRQNIYRLIDEVLESGEPLEIERKGRLLRIVPDQPVDRLTRIAPIPDLIVGDPESLVITDWSAEWDEEKALNP